MPDRYAAW